MIVSENSENTSKTNSKLEEFKKKHSDMEDELKRRLMMLKIKNLRLFLKQAD
jgi:L-rhamnose mutarotase